MYYLCDLEQQSINCKRERNVSPHCRIPVALCSVRAPKPRLTYVICQLPPSLRPSLSSSDIQITLPEASTVNNRISDRIQKNWAGGHLKYHPRRLSPQPAGCLPEIHCSKSLEPQKPFRIIPGNEYLPGNAL